MVVDPVGVQLEIIIAIVVEGNGFKPDVIQLVAFIAEITVGPRRFLVDGTKKDENQLAVIADGRRTVENVLNENRARVDDQRLEFVDGLISQLIIGFGAAGTQEEDAGA